MMNSCIFHDGGRRKRAFGSMVAQNHPSSMWALSWKSDCRADDGGGEEEEKEPPAGLTEEDLLWAQQQQQQHGEHQRMGNPLTEAFPTS